MAFLVELTQKALDDIEEAYVWIVERSPDHASRWYNALLESIFSLENFPTRCPVAPESTLLGLEVRQLLYGKRGGVYRILFRIEGEMVYVIRVRHGAREWLEAEELKSEE